MIKLGEMQELEVSKLVDFGVYLKSSDDLKSENKILLPLKQVPENTKIGDKINVFVYRDSSDREIATVKRPRLVMGEITYLKVVQMAQIGAFLNWGLEKDLFLPFKEQIGELKLNGEYLVGLYIDKSDRLCATMNMFNVLRTDSPYKVNDMVKGTVFSMKRGLGAMVAVEGKYLGLIHEGEILKPLHTGEVVEVRVSHIKEDGKLDLSLKDAPRLQIDKDGEKILNAIVKNKGLLLLNDDSSPEQIIEKLGLSKSSFKKAVGRLLKRNVIEMTREGMRLADDSKKVENKDNKKPYAANKGGRTTFNKDGKTSYNKDGKTSYNKDGKTSYKKDDKTSFNKDGKTSYKKDDKTSFNKDGKSTFNKDSKTSFNKDSRNTFNKDGRPQNSKGGRAPKR